MSDNFNKKECDKQFHPKNVDEAIEILQDYTDQEIKFLKEHRPTTDAEEGESIEFAFRANRVYADQQFINHLKQMNIISDSFEDLSQN